MREAAAAGDDHRVAGRRARRGAELERGHAEPAERLDQAEAARLIVADHVRLRGRAAVGGEPDGLGLGDQIADRQHQPVRADHDAVAGARGAEDRGGERVVRDLRAQAQDGRERALEVEGALRRFGLRRLGDRPLGRLARHLPLAHRRIGPRCSAALVGSRSRRARPGYPASSGCRARSRARQPQSPVRADAPGRALPGAGSRGAQPRFAINIAFDRGRAYGHRDRVPARCMGRRALGSGALNTVDGHSTGGNSGYFGRSSAKRSQGRRSRSQ